MGIIKHKDQRVGIFIDTSNLYHSSKHLHGGTPNFAAIMKDVLADRKLIRAIAYVVRTESGDETTFFDALGKAGIEVKVKDLQVFSSGAKKADWDVQMSIDMVAMSSKLDAIILMSGDQDFTPLVHYVQTQTAVQVEVVSFKSSTSSKLIDVADDFFDISQSVQKYILRKGSNNKNRRPKK